MILPKRRTLAHAAFRASAWLTGWSVGRAKRGRICPREGIGAAQCVGQPSVLPSVIDLRRAPARVTAVGRPLG
jgi:hypothetical protein